MTERAKPLGGTVPDDAFDVAVDMLTREQRRSRRARNVRKSTIGLRMLNPAQLRREAAAHDLSEADLLAVDVQRPRTRGECDSIPRPCPYVACRQHLYLDVTKQGGITLNFPDLEPDELAESCALDVADVGEHRLEDVGVYMNVTRERIRQLQVRAQERLETGRKLAEWEGHETVHRKDLP